MREPQQIEIALVDRVEELRHPARHEPGKLREMPGHDDEKSEHEISRRERQDGRRTRDPLQADGAAQRAPGAEYEQELPGERVEIPGPGGIRGEVPVQATRQRIASDR